MSSRPGPHITAAAHEVLRAAAYAQTSAYETAAKAEVALKQRIRAIGQ